MRKKNKIEHFKASFGKLKDEEYNFELIEKYFRDKDNSGSFQELSDKTCSDLDFEELFMFLDRTTSKIGQQCLYNKLRVLPNNSDGIDRKEKIIQALSEDSELRIRTQLQLDKLCKNDVYYVSTLFQEEYAKPPKWFFVIRLLSFTSLLSLLLFPFNPQLFFVFFTVFIVNLIIHYWNKRNLYKYLGSIPQLLRLHKVAVNINKEKLFTDIDPKLDDSIRILNQVRNRMSFFRLEAHLQSEMEAVFWFLMELFKITFILEPLLLFGILDRLDRKRIEIEKVFSYVGEVDILLSISSLRKGLDTYCLPKISESNFSATGVCHPLIYNCVPNNIQLSDKSILLTGSNMSGKTSFIRTIGINTLCGLTINTCFAEKMTIPRVRIFSAIRISDDLLNDKSYYFEEVLTIKDMIDNSVNGKPNLFLLDEIFKGTNTIERISAGKAVLSLLAKWNNIVFVSTHDIELTDLLQQEYELFHFSELVNENNVDFDYKLKEGKLLNRNAIRILQINNYPDDLIDEAIALSKTLDNKSS